MQESKKGIERGQSITFRVPSDTPDYLLKQLQKLKDTERRNFSAQIAQFVLKGVSETFSRERETLTIPLPKQLTKEQKNWLKHEHSEALIGSILYHLLQDPIRATALLASMNSNARDVDEALYLQEEIPAQQPQEPQQEPEPEAASESYEIDLDNLDMGELDDFSETEQQVEETKQDTNPLGDFFSRMNK